MCMRSMLTIEPKNTNWVPAFAGMTLLCVIKYCRIKKRGP